MALLQETAKGRMLQKSTGKPFSRKLPIAESQKNDLKINH
jgi:hypothetical protein